MVMNNPLYLLISVIIGTSIILLLVRISTYANEENIEAIKEEILIRDFYVTQEIIEHHLKKIGFKIGNNSIVQADSQLIKFLCDDDEDGFIDTLEIKLGKPALNSENPLDYNLLFVKNNDEKIITPSGVTKFKLEYFDINGNPVNENVFIKSIRVILRMESEERINGKYLYFENHFLIKPKNLV